MTIGLTAEEREALRNHRLAWRGGDGDFDDHLATAVERIVAARVAAALADVDLRIHKLGPATPCETEAEFRQWRSAARSCLRVVADVSAAAHDPGVGGDGEGEQA